jgi:hypothetical protein
MAGFTNKGKAKLLDWALRQTAVPTNFYIALVTSAVVPTADTNTLGELTEIAAGNGYSQGGVSINPDSTDFDVITEDDTNDRGLIKIKDIIITASGGVIPASGDDGEYVVLTDDNATVADREVYFYWGALSTPLNLVDTQNYTLQDLELRLNES